MLSRGASNPCRCCCCAAAASAGRRLLCCTAACRRRCLRVLRRAAHLPLLLLLLQASRVAATRAHRQKREEDGRVGGRQGGAAGQMCSDKFQLLVGAGCARTCTSVFFIFSVTNKGLSTSSSILTASNLPMLQSRSQPLVFLVKTFLKEIQSLN